MMMLWVGWGWVAVGLLTCTQSNPIQSNRNQTKQAVVVVTGATGYIASWIVKELLAQGKEGRTLGPPCPQNTPP